MMYNKIYVCMLKREKYIWNLSIRKLGICETKFKLWKWNFLSTQKW